MTKDSEARPPLFEELSRAQAKDYLARFVAELPASQDRLADMLVAAGSGPELARSMSPSGLDPLWETVVQGWELSYQADFVPGAVLAAVPSHEATWEALGPIDQLPSWFAHDWYHYMRFSPTTLWVIDVLARQVGQMLVHNHSHLEWVVGPDRPATNVDRSRPVVGSRRAWVNTVRRLSVLVERTMRDAHPPKAYFTTLAGLYQYLDDEVQKW